MIQLAHGVNISLSAEGALIIYKLYLANQKQGNPPIGTRDIDSLIPRKVPATIKKNIAKHLHDAGFKPVFKDLELPATQAYTKEIDGLEIEIEFLTDSAVRKDKNKNVTIAGIVAQPLSYLTLSLQITQDGLFHPERGYFIKDLPLQNVKAPLK